MDLQQQNVRMKSARYKNPKEICIFSTCLFLNGFVSVYPLKISINWQALFSFFIAFSVLKKINILESPLSLIYLFKHFACLSDSVYIQQTSKQLICKTFAGEKIKWFQNGFQTETVFFNRF